MRQTRPIVLLLLIVSSSLVFLRQAPTANARDISGDMDGFYPRSDSPYHVKGNLTIQPDATATIERGSVIYFDGNYSLTVKGKLVAIGTSVDQITFAWKDGGTQRNNWKGIILQSTTRPSTISYCTISNARAALTIEGSLYNVITNNIIRYNNAAILIQAAQGNIISDNEIYENTECGVSVRNGCQRILISSCLLYTSDAADE